MDDNDQKEIVTKLKRRFNPHVPDLSAKNGSEVADIKVIQNRARYITEI